MAAEQTQEIGRRGVQAIKRWLEATTFIELPFDAYNQPIDCTVVTSTTYRKCFDLSGFYITGDKDPVRVECKRYSSAGSQYGEFQEFLATAYGATLWERNEYGSSRNSHFLWVTYHPFQITSWTRLETPDEMRDAVASHPEIAGDSIDESVIFDVSSRVGLFVLNRKQEALTLTSDELQKVRMVLNRKANSL